jgi:hypothetical protein
VVARDVADLVRHHARQLVVKRRAGHQRREDDT